MSAPLPPPPLDAKKDRQPVSLRLSSTARTLLASLAYEQGISQAGVIELLLRRASRESGTDTVL